ncbi:hypothetical protein PoB_002622900 [Plakobranchus ocellatus]|uniref:Uncharacterized protein n=1 Tax=Plakobranchus ocellatus TaxID=259542 RepID=A0AAV3ZZC1_9GAST|nr:hypothetical protein PoB_002622900 [Plakobranchus ocellatus]
MDGKRARGRQSLTWKKEWHQGMDKQKNRQNVSVPNGTDESPFHINPHPTSHTHTHLTLLNNMRISLVEEGLGRCLDSKRGGGKRGNNVEGGGESGGDISGSDVDAGNDGSEGNGSGDSGSDIGSVGSGDYVANGGGNGDDGCSNGGIYVGGIGSISGVGCDGRGNGGGSMTSIVTAGNSSTWLASPVKLGNKNKNNLTRDGNSAEIPDIPRGRCAEKARKTPAGEKRLVARNG